MTNAARRDPDRTGYQPWAQVERTEKHVGDFEYVWDSRLQEHVPLKVPNLLESTE